MEWAFGPTADEPVFVKNIETVQGDERDVILFSVTYGPDRTGRVSMNFGPLNRDGGERRLNVALTRARREMMVFSTLNPDQIDLSRTNARAIRDLKHFLQFAEHGPQALERAASAPLGDFESPLEEQIAAELAKRGWTVHPQIGVSGYRIDLGVVDPDNPGRYVAGIEADGAMYHSAAGARERDKIRQAALEAPALDNASRMVDRLVGRQRHGDREAGREAEDPDRIRSDDGPREKLTNSSYVKAPPEALSRGEP